MSKVWLIRHVESEANAGLSTSNPEKVEITRCGRKHANAIAQSIPTTPSLIVTSSYTRSKQTAQPTLELFPDVPHEEWPVHEFTYLARSHQFSTKQERQPLVETFWGRNDPEYVDGEGAESFSSFIARVEDVFDRLNKLDDEEFIIIFSHGQFIRAVLWTLKYRSFPTNMKKFQSFLNKVPLQNGAVLEIPSWRCNMNYSVKQLPARPSFFTSACKLLVSV